MVFIKLKSYCAMEMDEKIQAHVLSIWKENRGFFSGKGSEGMLILTNKNLCFVKKGTHIKYVAEIDGKKKFRLGGFLELLKPNYLVLRNSNGITWCVQKKNTIFFGSRNLYDSKMKYKLYRKILGILFSSFVNIFFSINLKDTQCGFKLYRRKEAKLIFKNLKDQGFAHDIELILLAKKYNISITELPVNWTHRDNSKLNIFLDTFKMFYNLIKIKINHN